MSLIWIKGLFLSLVPRHTYIFNKVNAQETEVAEAVETEDAGKKKKKKEKVGFRDRKVNEVDSL